MPPLYGLPSMLPLYASPLDASASPPPLPVPATHTHTTTSCPACHLTHGRLTAPSGWPLHSCRTPAAVAAAAAPAAASSCRAQGLHACRGIWRSVTSWSRGPCCSTSAATRSALQACDRCGLLLVAVSAPASPAHIGPLAAACSCVSACFTRACVPSGCCLFLCQRLLHPPTWALWLLLVPVSAPASSAHLRPHAGDRCVCTCRCSKRYTPKTGIKCCWRGYERIVRTQWLMCMSRYDLAECRPRSESCVDVWMCGTQVDPHAEH
eukprot:366321-Chlamydomonas_euryale.AAC.2